MVDENLPIFNVKRMQTLIQNENQTVLPVHLIRKVLKQDLKMKYKKIKRVPFSGNSDRNLILRQQLAIKMIELFQQDIEIINIDETWISQTDFRRRKWKVSGTTNSLPNPLVNPRISLIVALSNRGDMYFTVSQGNTNLESFKIFMVYLMKKLDA
jgi:hypothetical protein